jgi:hypothetical protein
MFLLSLAKNMKVVEMSTNAVLVICNIFYTIFHIYPSTG